MRNLGSVKRPGKRSLDPTVGFDHTFFFGDLNYRIAAPIEMVLDALEREEQTWGKMHTFDQLREEMGARRVLSGFNETPPDFPPTFKRIKAGGKATDMPLEGDDAMPGADPFAGTANKRSKKSKRPSGMLSAMTLAIKSAAPGKGADFGAAAQARCAGPTIEEEEGEEEEEDEDDDEASPSIKRKSAQKRVSTGDAGDVIDGSHLADDTGQAAERLTKLGYNSKRVPSWCDRVLWRSYPMCSCVQTSYGAAEEVDTSDHTPVFATFTLRVLLPHDDESKSLAGGDLYQWEFTVANVRHTILPLHVVRRVPFYSRARPSLAQRRSSFKSRWQHLTTRMPPLRARHLRNWPLSFTAW
jgi:hypothetical protein